VSLEEGSATPEQEKQKKSKEESIILSCNTGNDNTALQIKKNEKYIVPPPLR